MKKLTKEQMMVMIKHYADCHDKDVINSYRQSLDSSNMEKYLENIIEHFEIGDEYLKYDEEKEVVYMLNNQSSNNVWEIYHDHTDFFTEEMVRMYNDLIDFESLSDERMRDVDCKPYSVDFYREMTDWNVFKKQPEELGNMVVRESGLGNYIVTGYNAPNKYNPLIAEFKDYIVKFYESFAGSIDNLDAKIRMRLLEYI